MAKKKTDKKATSLSPIKESILTVLYRYGHKGIYNLHVLDEMQKADEFFGRKKTSLGTFYPTVKRLEDDDGFVEGFWDSEEIKPGVRRRYLRITGTGVKALIDSREYRAMLEGKENIEDPRVPIPGLANSSACEGGLS